MAATTGLLIFWDLADFSNRHKLSDALDPHGFVDLVPAQRTYASALRAALERTYPKPNFLVQSLLGGGYEVVSITKHATHSDMVGILQVFISATPPEVRWQNEPASEVHTHIADELRMVPSSDVNLMLGRILERLGGVNLKPGKAIYTLPVSLPGYEPPLKVVAPLSKIIRECGIAGVNDIYMVGMYYNPDAMRAIKKTLEKEIASGSKKEQREAERKLHAYEALFAAKPT
jgi:hypothetical protein